MPIYSARDKTGIHCKVVDPSNRYQIVNATWVDTEWGIVNSIVVGADNKAEHERVIERNRFGDRGARFRFKTKTVQRDFDLFDMRTNKLLHRVRVKDGVVTDESFVGSVAGTAYVDTTVTDTRD